MNINLKKYQTTALNDLVFHTGHFLDREGKGETIVFQAPTGSGKTFVMAKFIERIIKERPKDNLCFIWLSIGKGELHKQSRNALASIFDGAPKVALVEEEFGGGRKIIAKNEVVVASWNKLWSKNSKTGEWKVLLMKDGEKTNFREVLAETNKRRKIILIIDESQIGHDAPRVNEVRELIDAEVVVEVSATPKNIAGNAHIKIEPKDVIEEGMIKKELIINEGLEESARKMKNEKDSQELILEMAYKKRVEIQKEFKKIGSAVNPLVLIQIPDAEAGDIKVEVLKDFLRKRGETLENGKLGIWLAENKTDNLVGITDNDDDTNFLIFKQAINTGWDCPRAHILVKLREVGNSEVFEIQTVGRILRMPERKHYGDDLLDVGYIYSNSERISVRPDEYKMDIIKNLPAKRIGEYKDIKLKSYYKTRADYGDITANFDEVFSPVCSEYFGIKVTNAKENAKKMENKDILIDGDKYLQKIISDTGIKTDNFDNLSGAVSAEAFARLSLSADDTEIKFYDFLKHCVRDGGFGNVSRSAPIVASAIYAWFEEFLDAKKWKEWGFVVQSIIVDDKNREHFEKILSSATLKYGVVKVKQIKERIKKSAQEYIFELPLAEYFNENADEMLDRVPHYAMKPCYLWRGRSVPEKSFENFLEENGEKLVWWWKNGVNKKEYFGIKYEYGGETRTFYPDYLLCLKNGNVGILEVKSETDQ